MGKKTCNKARIDRGDWIDKVFEEHKDKQYYSELVQILNVLKDYFDEFDIFKFVSKRLQFSDALECSRFAAKLEDKDINSDAKRIAVNFLGFRRDRNLFPWMLKCSVLILDSRTQEHAKAISNLLQSFFRRNWDEKKFEHFSNFIRLNLINCDSNKIDAFAYIANDLANFLCYYRVSESRSTFYKKLLTYINYSKSSTYKWVCSVLAINLKEIEWGNDNHLNSLFECAENCKEEKLERLKELLGSTSIIFCKDIVSTIELFANSKDEIEDEVFELCKHVFKINFFPEEIFYVNRLKYKSQVAAINEALNYITNERLWNLRWYFRYVDNSQHEEKYNNVEFIMKYYQCFFENQGQNNSQVIAKLDSKSKSFCDKLLKFIEASKSCASGKYNLKDDQLFSMYCLLLLDVENEDQIDDICNLITTLYSKFRTNDQSGYVFREIEKAVLVAIKSNNFSKTIEMLQQNASIPWDSKGLTTGEIEIVSKSDDDRAYDYINIISQSENFKENCFAQLHPIPGFSYRVNLIEIMVDSRIYELFYGLSNVENEKPLVLKVLDSLSRKPRSNKQEFKNKVFYLFSKIVNALKVLSESQERHDIYMVARSYLSDERIKNIDERTLYYFECICSAKSKEQATMVYKYFTEMPQNNKKTKLVVLISKLDPETCLDVLIWFMTGSYTGIHPLFKTFLIQCDNQLESVDLLNDDQLGLYYSNLEYFTEFAKWLRQQFGIIINDRDNDIIISHSISNKKEYQEPTLTIKRNNEEYDLPF